MSRVYMCTESPFQFYELNPDTLLDISSGGTNTPNNEATRGIGGMGPRLFGSTLSNKLYELDPDTMLDITGGGVTPADAANPWGIGGMADTLYYGTPAGNRTYELDPDTLLTITSAADASGADGLGGMLTKLFSCNLATEKNFELDPDTRLDITGGGVTSSVTIPLGIGGTANSLYQANNGGGKVMHELDPDTLLQIGATGGTPSNFPDGLGGTKIIPATDSPLMPSLYPNRLMGRLIPRDLFTVDR